MAVPKRNAGERFEGFVERLNEKIRRLNATHGAGPPTTLAPLDVDAVLARWRETRSLPPSPGGRSP